MRKKIDLTGQRFGRLTVIKTVGKVPKGFIWECKCDCGNVVNVPTWYLRHGDVSSCGCLHDENSKLNVKKAHETTRSYTIDGTNVKALLRAQKPDVRNKSGTVGVGFCKARKNWRAIITFKGHVYYLGSYKNKEDAISARKEAEKQLHGKFLEWYFSEHPDKKQKPKE